jgi:adenylate cyclase
MDNHLFKKTLEYSQDKLIAEIIALFQKLCPSPGHPNETAAVTQEGLLKKELATLFQSFRDQESSTRTSEVTILLSDLHGFTAMTEQYPATSVVRMLNRYFSKMSEIIVTEHGGIIDKFMGDSIMVLFGLKQGRPDDLERALSCAVHMQLAMDNINKQNESLDLPTLYMGIGVNTGTVITGKLGSDLHSEYTAIGDEVNLASRIEAYCLRGQILISENAYKQAKDYIETGEPTSVFVKGKKDQVTLYELRSVRRPRQLFVPKRDLRKSPRVEIDMPFTYQHLDGKNVLPERHKGRILDISYSGFLCFIPERLEAYTEIKLTIALSMLGDEVSDIYAKVLRSEKKKDQYATNIEFTSLHIYARKAIKLFIDRIIQGR